MADQEETTPAEETESFLLAEEDIFAGPTEGFAEEGEGAPEEKKSALPRILLLGLLIVALGGIGFYYFSGLPEPPVPAPMPAKKQPIVVPPVPSQPAEPDPVPTPATASSPEPGTGPAPVEKPAVAAAAADPVPVLAAPSAPAAVPAPAPVPTAAFVLDAGTFLLQANWGGVEKKVRKLGFEPQLQAVQGTVPMTRLKVGTYPPAEARSKLADLAPTVPEAFAIARDGQTTLYAGSFFVLDRARSFADQLYAKGINVEEEVAVVPRTLQRVTFGAFPDRDTADQAATKARAAGLQVSVVQSR